MAKTSALVSSKLSEAIQNDLILEAFQSKLSWLLMYLPSNGGKTFANDLVTSTKLTDKQWYWLGRKLREAYAYAQSADAVLELMESFEKAGDILSPKSAGWDLAFGDDIVFKPTVSTFKSPIAKTKTYTAAWETPTETLNHELVHYFKTLVIGTEFSKKLEGFGLKVDAEFVVSTGKFVVCVTGPKWEVNTFMTVLKQYEGPLWSKETSAGFEEHVIHKLGATVHFVPLPPHLESSVGWHHHLMGASSDVKGSVSGKFNSKSPPMQQLPKSGKSEFLDKLKAELSVNATQAAYSEAAKALEASAPIMSTVSKDMINAFEFAGTTIGEMMVKQFGMPKPLSTKELEALLGEDKKPTATQSSESAFDMGAIISDIAKQVEKDVLDQANLKPLQKG